MGTTDKTAAAHPGASKMRADASVIRVLLITGLSGAGKSSVLKALEDIGYEAVDNLPFALLPDLMATVDDNPAHSENRGLAIGIDNRTRAFQVERFEDRYQVLKADPGVFASLVFCDCEDEVLRQRFTETRRSHPLAGDGPAIVGVRRERRIMEKLRDRADFVLDTTDLLIGDLRRIVRGNFSLEQKPAINITVMSFSYRRGLPRESDLVFDVRFLANPHYDKVLRSRTGLDPEVGAFIASDPACDPFLEQVASLLLSLLPRYENEGKAYVTIAFGCTGGRHRSVYMAEQLSAMLDGGGYTARIIHRELDRE